MKENTNVYENYSLAYYGRQRVKINNNNNIKLLYKFFWLYLNSTVPPAPSV